MNWFNRYPDLASWLLRLIVGLTFAWLGGQSLPAEEYKDFGKDRLNSRGCESDRRMFARGAAAEVLAGHN